LLGERGEGDGGVDIVEGDDAPRRLAHPGGDRDPVRDVGADDHEVGVANFTAPAPPQLPDPIVERHRAERWPAQVAVGAIPRLVALEE
jgi:hypothetical protein